MPAKQFLTGLFFLFLVTGTADARPHWKRIAIKATVLTATSIAQYKATTYCSRGDVERCTTGYGARRAWNWINVGAGAGAILLSEKCGDGFFCNGIAYAVPAAQVNFAIHDYRNYKPEEVHTQGNLILPKWMK